MIEDEAPPTPLPPAAQSPWPSHPAPHGATDADVARAAPPTPPPSAAPIGALGFSLIGGAVAAAIGLFFVAPPFRRKPKSPPARKPAATPRQRATTGTPPARTRRKPNAD